MKACTQGLAMMWELPAVCPPPFAISPSWLSPIELQSLIGANPEDQPGVPWVKYRDTLRDIRCIQGPSGIMRTYK